MINFCINLEKIAGTQNESQASNESTNHSDPQSLPIRMPINMLSNYSFDAIQSLCSKLEQGAERKNLPVIGNSFIKYSYPLLLLFGLCGNALTFMVMCRVHKRKRNFQKFSLSLGTLALADIAILIFGCLIEYLEEIVGIPVKAFSPASCKLTLFACYLFSCYSAYLHAFIAVERWNAVSRPLTFLSRFTFKTNRLILIALFLLCITINLPLLWFPSVNPIAMVDESVAIGLKTQDECQIQQDFILDLIDSFFNCLMPFSLTVVFSILTLIKLIHIKSSAAVNECKEEDTKINISDSRNNSSHAAIACNLVRINGDSIEVSKNVNKNKRQSSQSSQSSNKIKAYKLTLSSINNHTTAKSNVKLTLMLMALPISYLVTTFPIFLMALHGCLLMQDLTNPNVYKNQDDFHLVYTLAKFFMYLNNSIHILFYILFGKNLRKDFIALLM